MIVDQTIAFVSDKTISNSIAFKAFVHAKIIPPRQVILFDENDIRHLFEGEVYVLLTPYLSKGSYSKEQIVESLQEKVSASEVYYALLRLQERGYLEDVPTNMPKAIQSFCNLLDVPCSVAEKRLQDHCVSIKTFGNVSVDSLRSALVDMSIQVAEKEQCLTIAITDNYRDLELRKSLIQSKNPYLLIKPTRSEIWVGPLFIPGIGPCLDCLIEALKGNACEEVYIEQQTKRKTPLTISANIFPNMSTFAYILAANEIFKWLVKGDNPNLESKIFSYHFLRPEITSHQVMKKIHCLNCGVAPSLVPKPVLLESQTKHFTEDGGHRIQPPEETYKKFEHLISPITGIIEYLIPKNPSQSSSMHIYLAQLGGHVGHLEKHAIYNNLRMVGGGKGRSEAQAKTSCLCESIERYSGIYQGDEPKIKASLASLNEEAIHPESFLLFSQNQYKIREEWNQSCSSFHLIPPSFNPNEEFEWTPIWSLSNNKFKYLPTALCYYAYSLQKNKEFGLADSNGNAAGNTIEEAILQGFFELVERDSIALWWYSRIRRPEIDLKSFSDPHINRLISSYHYMNRKCWVLDITMDLNIPTFAAISCRDDEAQGEILFGFGSHFDPNIAISRALTEIGQSLFLVYTGTSKQHADSKQKTRQDWIRKEVLSNHPYLIPDCSFKKKQRLDYVRFDTSDIKTDIKICQRIVEEKGLEMLVLDQTRPDIGLPVVKVFVPGLRHFWNRFAPGRLYDVPFELGLVKQKLTEEELNPIPFFL